jgi:predicted Zn-dependent peptidase
MSEDHLVPVVGVSVAYNAGGRHEKPGKSGLAHLFEHMMFQGSRNVGKTEHFSILNRIGGIVNGGCSQDMTIYHQSLPSQHLELALWLEADRMGGLLDTLTQEKLDNQREVVNNERRESCDNPPYGRAGEMISERVYPRGHPYHGSFATRFDVDSATLDDLTRFFETFYAPNNATVALVGDIKPDAARELVHRHFGHLRANPAIPPAPDVSLPRVIGSEAREVVPDRVSLPRVYVAYRGPGIADPSIAALTVAVAILGQGQWSRLHRRLVRERRLAQDAGLFLDHSVGPSPITGSATARPEAELNSLEEAFLEITESLAQEPVTEDELQRARAVLERRHLEGLQMVGDRSNQLGIFATLWGSPESLNENIEALLAATPGEIRDAAAGVFRADNRVVLTFVPEEP